MPSLVDGVMIGGAAGVALMMLWWAFKHIVCKGSLGPVRSEARVYDSGVMFEEDHPVKKSWSWGTWQTCEVCSRQERGWRDWMWSVPTPQPIPHMSEDPQFADIPILAGSWLYGVGHQLVCQTCAPTHSAVLALRRRIFWQMKLGDAARWVTERRKETQERAGRPEVENGKDAMI